MTNLTCELPLRINILTSVKWIQVHCNKLRTNFNKLTHPISPNSWHLGLGSNTWIDTKTTQTWLEFTSNFLWGNQSFILALPLTELSVMKMPSLEYFLTESNYAAYFEDSAIFYWVFLFYFFPGCKGCYSLVFLLQSKSSSTPISLLCI